MLSEQIVEWTEQWKQDGLQQGLNSERRMLLRLIRRRFGETVAGQSDLMLVLGRIEQLRVFEDLGEELLDCADGSAWLVRLQAVAGEAGH